LVNGIFLFVQKFVDIIKIGWKYVYSRFNRYEQNRGNGGLAVKSAIT
jgi:hypothetical protein